MSEAHPFADMPFRPGQRIRVTVEGELLRPTVASANRGTACLLLRAGAGMNDGVWLVREPGYGEVISVEIVSEPTDEPAGSGLSTPPGSNDPA